MAYVLEAFLATEDALRELGKHHRGVRIVPLSQGLAMAPFTPELRSSIGSTVDVGDPDSSWPFRKLSREGARVGQEASTRNSLAYVEAEYFGGEGDQAAIVWKHGSMHNGPLQASDAINQALRALGIRATAPKDEFDTVGLSRCRSTEDWLEGTAEVM